MVKESVRMDKGTPDVKLHVEFPRTLSCDKIILGGKEITVENGQIVIKK